MERLHLLCLGCLVAVTITGTSAAEPAELDLGSRVKPVPPGNRFAQEGYHVWCGSPVRTPDGKCHLFYSRWLAAAGFHPGWAIRSEIAYAVADQPAGPYRPVNVALPARRPSFWDCTATKGIWCGRKEGPNPMPAEEWTARTSMIAHPSTTILLAEVRYAANALGQSGQGCANPSAQTGSYFAASYYGTATPPPNHRLKWNYLFTDGHVQTLLPKDTVLDGNQGAATYMWDRTN